MRAKVHGLTGLFLLIGRRPYFDIIEQRIILRCWNVIADEVEIFNAAMGRKCYFASKGGLQLFNLLAVDEPRDQILAVLSDDDIE